MNLTKKIKSKILIEFQRGMSMARCDDLYLQPPGTTERVVREALRQIEEITVEDLQLPLKEDANES